jgi:putative acetyltransferase
MIREYQTSDEAELLQTWEAASAVAHSFLSEAFLEQERHNIPNVYLPHAETWVWDDNGQVVAFLALIGNEVGAIFVAPQVQRRGIGQALMDFARERREQLELDVFEANAIGRAFYEKYGFEELSASVHEATGQRLLRLGIGPRR